MTVSDLNQHFSVFSLVLVSIGTVHQTPKKVFDQASKHLEVRQKYSASRLIFNSLLDVWKCGQTQFFVFDILRRQNYYYKNNYILPLHLITSFMCVIKTFQKPSSLVFFNVEVSND